MSLRTYSELITFDSFEDRFRYLQLKGRVGDLRFGSNRYLNQKFYQSWEWKKVRNAVIVRDNGCDLGHPDYPIGGPIQVHHINPISVDDLKEGSSLLFDPENLICVSDRTHRAITYGDFNSLPKPFVERKPNDTCPWLL